MTVERIGIGAGSKDLLDQPNILRLFVGTSPETRALKPDEVIVLETNLDDCPGEFIGFAIERLFEAGALDVFTIPIQMKKNRPGVLLSVIADPMTVPKLEAILFRETGTFGIRRTTMSRSTLDREMITVQTPWGPVKAKRGWTNDGTVVTLEYEDAARIARECDVPLREVYASVCQTAFKALRV